MGNNEKFRALRNQIINIKTWSRDNKPAINKPTVILYFLSAYSRGHSRLLHYNEIEKDIKHLLIDFGPERKSVHPEYPIWRLQTDGFWEVISEKELSKRKGNSNPLISEIKKVNIAAGFTQDAFETLLTTPGSINKIKSDLVGKFFKYTSRDLIDLKFDFQTIHGE